MGISLGVSRDFQKCFKVSRALDKFIRKKVPKEVKKKILFFSVKFQENFIDVLKKFHGGSFEPKFLFDQRFLVNFFFDLNLF